NSIYSVDLRKSQKVYYKSFHFTVDKMKTFIAIRDVPIKIALPSLYIASILLSQSWLSRIEATGTLIYTCL
ncbi:MAG: hypothetical protein ACK46E_06705, partial [Pseudanabaena sp.]